MFSHPARQNNSFRHSVDTNGIALTGAKSAFTRNFGHAYP